jgi:tetratricopeptide (TPR) repeat protein
MWHALAVAVALWAMSILFRFRVLGWPFLAYLPWVGSALVLLHLLLLANRFIAPASGEGTIQEVIRRLTFGARLVIIAFVYWAVFVAFNAGFDRTSRLRLHAQVVEVGGRTLSVGVPVIYSWASVRTSPSDGERLLTLILGPDEQRKFWGGESVVLVVGGGRFALPWVLSVERDQEVYLRQVIELAPDARQPRKDLVRFLFDDGRWGEAAAESQRYVDAHPDDGEFAYYAGENLNLRGLDGVPFLARAVALRPSRYHCYRLAWALTRQGDSARAIEALTAASSRYPDAWEFPFLLGYHYARTRRWAEAIASLERSDKLKPGVPDVAVALARLRAEAPGR